MSKPPDSDVQQVFTIATAFRWSDSLADDILGGRSWGQYLAEALSILSSSGDPAVSIHLLSFLSENSARMLTGTLSMHRCWHVLMRLVDGHPPRAGSPSSPTSVPVRVQALATLTTLLVEHDAMKNYRNLLEFFVQKLYAFISQPLSPEPSRQPAPEHPSQRPDEGRKPQSASTAALESPSAGSAVPMLRQAAAECLCELECEWPGLLRDFVFDILDAQSPLPMPMLLYDAFRKEWSYARQSVLALLLTTLTHALWITAKRGGIKGDQGDAKLRTAKLRRENGLIDGKHTNDKHTDDKRATHGTTHGKRSDAITSTRNAITKQQVHTKSPTLGPTSPSLPRTSASMSKSRTGEAFKDKNSTHTVTPSAHAADKTASAWGSNTTFDPFSSLSSSAISPIPHAAGQKRQRQEATIGTPATAESTEDGPVGGITWDSGTITGFTIAEHFARSFARRSAGGIDSPPCPLPLPTPHDVIAFLHGQIGPSDASRAAEKLFSVVRRVLSDVVPKLTKWSQVRVLDLIVPLAAAAEGTRRGRVGALTGLVVGIAQRLSRRHDALCLDAAMRLFFRLESGGGGGVLHPRSARDALGVLRHMGAHSAIFAHRPGDAFIAVHWLALAARHAQFALLTEKDAEKNVDTRTENGTDRDGKKFDEKSENGKQITQSRAKGGGIVQTNVHSGAAPTLAEALSEALAEARSALEPLPFETLPLRFLKSRALIGTYARATKSDSHLQRGGTVPLIVPSQCFERVLVALGPVGDPHALDCAAQTALLFVSADQSILSRNPMPVMRLLEADPERTVEALLNAEARAARSRDSPCRPGPTPPVEVCASPSTGVLPALGARFVEILCKTGLCRTSCDPNPFALHKFYPLLRRAVAGTARARVASVAARVVTLLTSSVVAQNGFCRDSNSAFQLLEVCRALIATPGALGRASRLDPCGPIAALLLTATRTHSDVDCRDVAAFYRRVFLSCPDPRVVELVRPVDVGGIVDGGFGAGAALDVGYPKLKFLFKKSAPRVIRICPVAPTPGVYVRFNRGDSGDPSAWAASTPAHALAFYSFASRRGFARAPDGLLQREKRNGFPRILKEYVASLGGGAAADSTEAEVHRTLRLEYYIFYDTPGDVTVSPSLHRLALARGPPGPGGSPEATPDADFPRQMFGVLVQVQTTASYEPLRPITLPYLRRAPQPPRGGGSRERTRFPYVYRFMVRLVPRFPSPTSFPASVLFNDEYGNTCRGDLDPLSVSLRELSLPLPLAPRFAGAWAAEAEKLEKSAGPLGGRDAALRAVLFEALWEHILDPKLSPSAASPPHDPAATGDRAAPVESTRLLPLRKDRVLARLERYLSEFIVVHVSKTGRDDAPRAQYDASMDRLETIVSVRLLVFLPPRFHLLLKFRVGESTTLVRVRTDQGRLLEHIDVFFDSVFVVDDVRSHLPSKMAGRQSNPEGEETGGEPAADEKVAPSKP